MNYSEKKFFAAWLGWKHVKGINGWPDHFIKTNGEEIFSFNYNPDEWYKPEQFLEILENLSRDEMRKLFLILSDKYGEFKRLSNVKIPIYLHIWISKHKSEVLTSIRKELNKFQTNT